MRLTYLEVLSRSAKALRVSFKFGDTVMHTDEAGKQQIATIKEVDYLDIERTFYIRFRAGGHTWCSVNALTKLKTK